MGDAAERHKNQNASSKEEEASMYWCLSLSFADSANGAGSFTSAAIDAGVCIYYIMIIALRNSANGALSLAGTAG